MMLMSFKKAVNDKHNLLGGAVESKKLKTDIKESSNQTNNEIK